MNTRNRTLALAVAAALVMPLAAQARSDFNYLEANYINVDLDFSESFTEDGASVSISTDTGGGFHIGGAWQVWENLHLFGEYSKASQDLKEEFTFQGVTESFKEDFDVIRYRLGAGYAFPVSNELSIYGRLSYDYLEFDLDDGGGIDDDGLGGELGLVWSVTPEFQVQPYVRYTSVGEIDTSDSESDDDSDPSFDSDVLFGVGARYFFTENFAVQAGYEYGEIKTWSIGARFAF